MSTDWAWCYEQPHEAAEAIDQLRAKVKHYEDIESEMLMIGVERAKAQYQDEIEELRAMLREIVEHVDINSSLAPKSVLGGLIEKARGALK
jgi:LPS sulfotransferase NodH